MLTDYKVPYLMKLPSSNWLEDVSLWPCLDLGKIFTFIIEKKPYGAEYIGQYKAKKAYSHFMSRFVHKIVVKRIGGAKVPLKGQVTPSPKLYRMASVLKKWRNSLLLLLMYSLI